MARPPDLSQAATAASCCPASSQRHLVSIHRDNGPVEGPLQQRLASIHSRRGEPCCEGCSPAFGGMSLIRRCWKARLACSWDTRASTGEGGQVASEAGAPGSRSICCSRLGRHEARARASRDAAWGQKSSPFEAMPCKAKDHAMLYSQIHYAPQKLQSSNAGMQLLLECFSCREHVTVPLTRHQGTCNRDRLGKPTFAAG